MAIGMTKLTNQTIEGSAVSVTAGTIEWASDNTGVIAAGSTNEFRYVNIQVAVTFGSSANGDAIIHTRKSADSGTTEDTEGDDTAVKRIPYEVSTTKTVTIKETDFETLDIGIENEGTVAITYTAKYEGSKITGMS